MPSITNLIRGTGREYFDLFERAGANVARAGELLDEMLAGFPESQGLAQDILVCERDGDQITHELINRLNQTFVTPIDRQDILDRRRSPASPSTLTVKGTVRVPPVLPRPPTQRCDNRAEQARAEHRAMRRHEWPPTRPGSRPVDMTRMSIFMSISQPSASDQPVFTGDSGVRHAES